MVAIRSEHPLSGGTFLPRFGTFSKTSWDVLDVLGTFMICPCKCGFLVGGRGEREFPSSRRADQSRDAPRGPRRPGRGRHQDVGRWLGDARRILGFAPGVAHVLDADELELWPEAKPTRTTEDPFKEIAGAWVDSAGPDAPDWASMLGRQRADRSARPHPHGLLTRPGIAETLAAKATRGAQVRILIAAPGASTSPSTTRSSDASPTPTAGRWASASASGQSRPSRL